MRPLLTTLIAVLALALTAVTARATVCQTQPGQGAIDQYCEIIPSGGGDRPSRTAGEQPELPAQAQRELRQAGPDGAIVEALGRTSPALAGSRSAGSTGSGSDGGSAGSPAGSDDPGALLQPRAASPTRSVSDSVPAGGSSSSALEALLRDPFGGEVGSAWVVWAAIAVALVTGTAAWRRRRVRWP